MTRWGKTALHNAILSDNDLDIVQVLLDRGADPALIASRPDRSARASPGQTAVAMAARRGRGDLLAAFERRGSALNLRGLDRLLAACARNDTAAVRAIAAPEPDVVDELRADGGRFLARFAGVDNVVGVRHLLDLGVDAGAVFADGDAYFDVAKNSLALHVCGLAREPRDGAAAHRARVARRRAGRPGADAAGARRPRVRRFVLDVSPHTGVGASAARRGRVGTRRRVPAGLCRG